MGERRKEQTEEPSAACCGGDGECLTLTSLIRGAGVCASEASRNEAVTTSDGVRGPSADKESLHDSPKTPKPNREMQTANP